MVVSARRLPKSPFCTHLQTHCWKVFRPDGFHNSCPVQLHFGASTTGRSDIASGALAVPLNCAHLRSSSFRTLTGSNLVLLIVQVDVLVVISTRLDLLCCCTFPCFISTEDELSQGHPPIITIGCMLVHDNSGSCGIGERSELTIRTNLQTKNEKLMLSFQT